ncbi:hypothetical protein [Rhodopila sp.]|uniref:hypothetical protein n=1 Tax=Rhodopila sp. TaxID=2480087 RepID=UPI003D134CDA
MSLPATIAPAVLDTILLRLAALFVTAASPATAREAASQTLAAYNVADEQELGLAADIIGFALHALEALGQAANPDLSLAKILRLRGSAVSLSRESHKARRKLDQLQRSRRAGANLPATEAQPKPIAPHHKTPHHKTPGIAAPARQPGIAVAPPPEARLPAAPPPEATQPPADASPIAAVVAPGKPEAMTWTQSYRKRHTERRLARKALRVQAAQAQQATQQATHHHAQPLQANPHHPTQATSA